MRLRDSETALKTENASLKAALDQNGLSVPNGPSRSSWRASVSPPSDAALLFAPSSPSVGNVSSATSVTIDLTELSVIEPEKWCSVTAAMEETRPFEIPTVSLPQLSGFDDQALSSTLRAGSVGNYGDSPALSPQAAIDFVLEYGHCSDVKTMLTELSDLRDLAWATSNTLTRKSYIFLPSADALLRTSIMVLIMSSTQQQP